MLWRSEPYQFATSFIKGNSVVMDRVGSVRHVSVGLSGFAESSYDRASGSAEYRMNVSGDKGKGVVHLSLGKTGGVWTFKSGNLALANGQEIQLSSSSIDGDIKSGISEANEFPPIEVVAPMRITRVDVFPEQSVCVIGHASVVQQLIARWAHDYERGWKRSYVSLAPIYRITVGKTEILVLRRGLAVVIQTIGGKRVTYGRELPEGVAEQIVREACSAK